MLNSLLSLDIKTMIGILFCGNLTSALLIFSYQTTNKSGYDAELVKLLYFSRFIKATYYLLIFCRGIIPDIASVNLGNTLMYISLYMDGYMMLKLSKVSSKTAYYLLRGFFVCSVTLFNFVELYFRNPDIRVPLTSLFMFALLFLPSCFLVFTRTNSRFTKTVGFFYVSLLILVLSRAVYGVTVEPIYIFTKNPIQSLTFISITLIMVFSAPAFLLIMKENADKIIAEMAETDGLTKLQNRQTFMNVAQRCFERHKKTETEITLLFFDLDYFKTINDTYGHSFGDEVLVKFAGIIRHNMRSNDFSCRYGGEEFIALLPGCGEQTGVSIGERIMCEVGDLHFDVKPQFKFTVSIGLCAGVPSGNDTLPIFINRADEALYEAKNTGRNKIVVYRETQ